MYKICSIELESCEVLHLEIDQEIDDRSTSPYGVQQKMCRDFLSAFSMCGILVAPQQKLNEIMIVGKSDSFSDEIVDFQGWLTKEALTVKSVAKADCFSVEECIRFSIFVWMESHQYYRCGNDLIKGPFVGKTSSDLTRIFFNVHCTSIGEVFIHISPDKVRLYSLQTWNVQNPSGRWVYCLPKLSRGQVVSQCCQLPSDSGFANYVEMRAYWKNCHGYDLPLEEPKTYYYVLFKGIAHLFLYPDFCLLFSQPASLHLRYYNAFVPVSEFCQAFLSKNHLICMEEIKLIMDKTMNITLSGRSFGSSTYKRRTSCVTRDDLPQRFVSVTFKGDVQVEDNFMNQRREIAGSSKAVNLKTDKCFATSYMQNENVVKRSRDRKRLVDVE